jgi:hypothetical protein
MFAKSIDAARMQGPAQSMPSAALGATGYFVSRSQLGDHLVIDGGPHGFQNGGHAHADALSLTLTHAGVPFLIDPGTGSYTSQPRLRDRLRSSAAHNTLTLDGRSQSIPHGPFHWLNRTNATLNRWQTGDTFDYFEATHDAYHPSLHRRHVLMRPDDVMLVADVVEGTGIHRVDVHWHVDPRWRTELSGQRARFTLVTDPTTCVSLAVHGGALELFVADEETGLGWHSPVYGRLEPAATLRISNTTELPACIVSVFPLNRANDLLATEVVTAQSADREPALRIALDRTESIDHLQFGPHVGFERHLKSARRKLAG